MSYAISDEDVKRVEKILKSDILWAIKSDKYKWDPNMGASHDDGKWDGAFYGERRPKRCGVCAIGAHVVRHQPERAMLEQDCDVAARQLNAPIEFVEEIYCSVTWDKGDRFNDPSPGEALGQRLRDWADAKVKEYRAKKRTARK